MNLSGRFLYDIHLGRWTIRVLFGNSPGWLVVMEVHYVTYLWSREGEKSFSLSITLLSRDPICVPTSFDWYGLCSRCSLAASISCWLLLPWICCVYQPGRLSVLMSKNYVCHRVCKWLVYGLLRIHEQNLILFLFYFVLCIIFSVWSTTFFSSCKVISSICPTNQL